MTDDLIVICLVLVFFDEVSSTGKCDLTDIFFDFVRSHTKTVIDEFQSLCIRIYDNLDLWSVILRKLVFTHHFKLFQFGNGVTAVTDQLAVENVMVGIEPFLDDRKKIIAVD